MEFLSSRCEQLTDHLRTCIAKNELAEPLPNTRAWAAQLGVSCTTLYAALHALRREKLIYIHPRRGVRLNHRKRIKGNLPNSVKIVRIIYRAVDYPDFLSYSNWIGLFSQQLQAHQIQLSIEKCTDVRLSALIHTDVQKNAHVRELLLLRSLSEKYQGLFSKSGRPSLVVGYPAPGTTLPYVEIDLEGAIRHATHSLLRRGFSTLTFLTCRVTTHAIQRQCDAFDSACDSWPHQPIRKEILRVPLEASAQVSFLTRFASRVSGRRGIIVVAPLSIGAVATSLLRRGIAIPQQVELTIIDSTMFSSIICPLPARYIVSLEAFSKALTRAAVHYFENAALPPFRKTIPCERIEPEAIGSAG